jgi:pSer/pThr/pTyr-binding forkhead associated (FHA) protein
MPAGQDPYSTAAFVQTVSQVRPRLVDSSGYELVLGDGANRVGREVGCTVTLTSDGTISRQHAEIRIENGNYAITDLNSTNGTTVNGSRLHGSCELRDGDAVSFGSTHFTFRV